MIPLTCSSLHCVQEFQVRQKASPRKQMTSTAQSNLSAIQSPLSKTYEIPWIDVRSAKSSVVCSKATFPFFFSLIPAFTAMELKEG